MRRLFTFVAAGLLAAGAAAPAEEPLTITRRYTPADRERDRYVYVPFDVPAGTTELRIEYDYDRAGGRTTIDLGVFEPGSLELHTTAMRGYSGGSKSDVTIGQCESSPGYKTGPIPAGKWHVMLGLYQVADTGVEVTMSVTSSRAPCHTSGGVIGTGMRRTRAGEQWWSGALHTHTLHSDGAVTAVELLRRSRGAGLDFVTLTDHNNTTHFDDLIDRPEGHADAPLWITGEEVTTPAGHANVWGLAPGEWVDFRVRPHERRIDELVGAAHRYGALFSMNHPVAECAGCAWEHEVPAGLDAIEVWNGRVGPQDGAVAIWERLLRDGRRVTAVGASDWHRDPDAIDRATVRVFAPELTHRHIVAAIRSGRVIVMRSARDAAPVFTIRSGARAAGVGQTLAIGGAASIEIEARGLAGGRAVVVLNATRIPVALDGAGKGRLERALEPGYIRLETYDANGEMVAFTNPVYLVE